ncbi:hypothetical protein K474DRAFT_1588145 [Panus rudis PR-1116 ss-1]|nr:hypothetical protein K474DRAFT_1588145 [Panus rudis PR-1116 ss-1]
MGNPQLDDRPHNAAASYPAPPLILPAFSVASSSSTTPSTPTSSVDPKKAAAQPKRKRPADPASDSADSSSHPPTRTRDGPKKKKANRACFHCQKAHLTCDDSRPCQRCIKRGMADNCTEGHRKKAKYLLDDEELASHQTFVARPESIFASYANPSPSTFPYSNSTEAANLEYSIISSILGNSPESGSSGSPSTTNAQVPQRNPYVPSQPTTNLVTASWPAEPIQQTYGTNGTSSFPSTSIAQSSGVVNSPTSTWGGGQLTNGYGGNLSTGVMQDASSVYKSVTKPYDYTEGYHFLMRHLCSRYAISKNDILRIVRALAIFRPSLIALQMPMTEEDEVFVEKCFQRSLVELDRLVSFSGTPTVAWRRTGEICLVGPEFCMLSGWERDELTGPGRRKYIYELFENQSVVEYWENFANHAFENTTQSVYSHCVLLKPNGTPVPCTFCFSIRRDIMDLPSLVIGEYAYRSGLIACSCSCRPMVAPPMTLAATRSRFGSSFVVSSRSRLPVFVPTLPFPILNYHP